MAVGGELLQAAAALSAMGEAAVASGDCGPPAEAAGSVDGMGGWRAATARAKWTSGDSWPPLEVAPYYNQQKVHSRYNDLPSLTFKSSTWT